MYVFKDVRFGGENHSSSIIEGPEMRCILVYPYRGMRLVRVIQLFF